ncbi:MmcQ/YjbR family DNA-binding protein [Pseudoalteromonas obscura]|uniref:MmcQ/YjbR family DNA-binding protein n=1 Tax=Pseudoalteromonas obscura TaxID=3048491 RepID=A0ABT7EIV1_9GAMM|nr:MmcQ/YjbR family DNA-binding protein [Pseudoalteromonas sp. P94(2023)]MDK2594985.1 MmcQ/YjbR family DNA-binding protein [Pseudoalteromonas sp. P94(2023)]
MSIDRAVHDYLMAKPFSDVSQPFGEGVDVYKVKGKMFATLSPEKMRSTQSQNTTWWLNLKCDPHEALMLRDIFDAVIPGYHMNKQHWNTIILDGTVPKGEIERMIDNSYLLVVKKMRKSEQNAIMLHL